MSVMDPEFIAKNFPTLSDMTYLNNASTGIPPVDTVTAMHQWIEDCTRGVIDFETTLELLEGVRRDLRSLLGGEIENYGLVPSTSEGLNIAAHGLTYPPHSNIVICDLEFPSNYIPWQHACRLYGAELRVVRSQDGAAPIDRFAEMIDENTCVVAVSHVQFGSGYRTDLRTLARLVHDVGGILVVDIIQSAGCLEINLPSLGVDFASAQAAKWMLGPVGAGFIYVSDEAIERIRPRFLGWWGVTDIEDFSYRQRELLPGAARFQIGSPAMISYVGFKRSLEVLLRLKDSDRERQAMNVADYLRKRLAEQNIEFYDFGHTNNSPIVSCRPADVESLNRRLLENRIHCSVRNGRLRVSPHFYNRREDVDRLMEHMRR